MSHAERVIFRPFRACLEFVFVLYTGLHPVLFLPALQACDWSRENLIAWSSCLFYTQGIHPVLFLAALQACLSKRLEYTKLIVFTARLESGKSKKFELLAPLKIGCQPYVLSSPEGAARNSEG